MEDKDLSTRGEVVVTSFEEDAESMSEQSEINEESDAEYLPPLPESPIRYNQEHWRKTNSSSNEASMKEEMNHKLRKEWILKGLTWE